METDNYIDDKSTIDDLFKRSLRFKSSSEFAKFFNFIARFNHYSRYNTMLVYIQNPNVTFFGGKSFWKKKFNRNIKEDAERPYIILAPNGPVMLAYDVFGTEGEDSPEEFLKKGLGRKPFEVDGYIEKKIFNRAIEEAKAWGIKIFFKPFSFFKGGHVTTIFANRLEICLKEGMSKEENFAVLVHELAHLFLGHTGHRELHYDGKERPYILVKRNKLTRTAEELEAETVSYLICRKIGLESRAAEYIAGYITSDEDLKQFSHEIVIKTADKIESLFCKL